MSRVLVVLLAGTAALLAIGSLQGPWFGRGAGGAELMISAVLLSVAWVIVKASGLRGGAALAVYLLPPILMAGIVVRSQLNARADADLQACQGNLGSVATAVEQARQARGRLPEMLPAPVVACPAAGPYGYDFQGEAYTLFCQGDAHSRHFYDDPRVKGPNFPQYSSPAGKVLLGP